MLAGAAFGAKAQTNDGGKFNIGIETGIPLGNASDISSIALGASLKYELPIVQKTYFTISAGYSEFLYSGSYKDFLREYGVTKSSSGFVPLKAGIKYYFSPNFFGEAQAGAAISTDQGGGTAFAYAPGVGYSFNGGFEFGVRFEGWTHDGSLNQVGFRLAYRF